MKLPVGMLIFWTARFSDDHAVICGVWYYKELYVPHTSDEKKEVINDMKKKRCLVLSLSGTFDQILDLLLQSDKYDKGSNFQLIQFNNLMKTLMESEKSVIFDDIKNVKGTALSLDTTVEIDQDMDFIHEKLAKNERSIIVMISKNWSFANDISNAFKGMID